MEAGLVVGLSVGLAVLVLIILVFGCKFARKNTEDKPDFSKELLLDHGAVYRHKDSKTILQSGERGSKTTHHKQKRSRRKSVTFNDKDKPGATDDKDEAGANEPEYQPEQRLLSEYMESNDNNGTCHLDEWSRDCQLEDRRDYQDRGCKRKQKDSSSERTKNRDPRVQIYGYDRRQKYLKTGVNTHKTDMLNGKRQELHNSKRQCEADVLHGNSKRQYEADVLHGNSKRQYEADVLHGNSKRQYEADVLHGNSKRQYEADVLHGNSKRQYEADVLHGNSKRQYEADVLHGNSKRQYEADVLHDNSKRQELHNSKRQCEVKPTEQRPLSRNTTVKQIVEEVKRNSKHNLQNGTRIKINYDTIYAENDFQINHGSERKDNINHSSGKKVARTHLSKRSKPSVSNDRLLSRPQERQVPYPAQEQTETFAGSAKHRIYEPRNTGQDVDESRQGEETNVHWYKDEGPVHHLYKTNTKPSTRKHQVEGVYQVPSGHEIPLNNINNQTPLSVITSTTSINRHIGAESAAYSVPYETEASNGPIKNNIETITTKPPSENNSFTDALATWLYHSESGERIPRPSTTTPYIVYSQRPPATVNAQRSFASTSRAQFRQHVSCASVENTLTDTGQAKKSTNRPLPPPAPPLPRTLPSYAITASRNYQPRATASQQLSPLSNLQPGPLQLQLPPSENTQSSIVSEPLHNKQLSPTTDLQTGGASSNRFDKQVSPTARPPSQLSPSRHMQSIPPQILPNIEQSPNNLQTPLPRLKPNDDLHVSPTVNLQPIVPQPQNEKQSSPKLNPYVRSPNKEKPSGKGLESQSHATSARLQPSPPSRPLQQSSKQHPSPKRFLSTDTSTPLSSNQTSLKSPDIIPAPFTLDTTLTTPNEHTLEFTLPKQAEIQSFEHVENGHAKAIEITDFGNSGNENKQTPDEALSDKTRTEQTISERTDIQVKDSVDFIASESDFNPGKTSTPQQSTTEISDGQNIRTNRSVLHSVLKKRRGRIVSSSQDMSNFCSDESGSFWNESMSPIRKSVSVDGTLFYIQAEEKPETAPSNESLNRVSSDLTEKIATVRDIRKDPDINALLSDIRARRKSSSSFN